jgi:hypothetical protein
MVIDGKINEKPDRKNGNDESNPSQLKPDREIEIAQNENTREGPGNITDNDQNELVQMISKYWQKIYTSHFLRSTLRRIIYIAIIIFIALFIFSWFVFIVPGLQEAGKGTRLQPSKISELIKDPLYKKLILQSGRDAQRLTRKFTAYTPGQSYLVINTTDNRFFLYRNKKPVREGFCSTGSYTRLTNSEGSRHWIFKTPKGRFWIQQKITSPLWVRPDWSFVEEGLPIPPANDESRFEYGVLGKYAMSLGDGYLIHGTIYKRFLGMPVTHGCVRLNDEDLEDIYNTLNIGSKVYIF